MSMELVTANFHLLEHLVIKWYALITAIIQMVNVEPMESVNVRLALEELIALRNFALIIALKMVSVLIIPVYAKKDLTELIVLYPTVLKTAVIKVNALTVRR